MIFNKTKLPGVFVLELECKHDQRGFFARGWCRREFEEQGLTPVLEQCSVSFSRSAGTLRGLHFQTPPHAEARLIRCTRGALHDVVVDLRPDSPTRMQWVATLLTADNYRSVYIPEGCAHGFLTLEDNTEAYYHISAAYQASSCQGVRWDDPAFGIELPMPVRAINDRDRTWPDFRIPAAI